MATQRIYIVKNNTTGTVRLIKSTVVSQAVAHAAKSDFEAHVATQDELVDGLNAGIKIEKTAITAANQLELL
jgi:hypothetical protein